MADMPLPLKGEFIDRHDENGQPLFKLTRSFKFSVGPGSTVTVPRGYITNFGTVPRWLYRLMAPGEMREAAVVHDWLCNEDFGDSIEGQSGYSRWMADAHLYEAMRYLGFSWWRCAACFALIRLWVMVNGGQ